MPGPHDFAVASVCSSAQTSHAANRHAHRIPAPTFVTIAKRPSWQGRDGRKCAADLPDGASDGTCDKLARRAICAWHSCADCPSGRWQIGQSMLSALACFNLAPLAGRGRIASQDAIRVRGTLHEFGVLRLPLTPTLSPHPPSPFGLRRTRAGRGSSPSAAQHLANNFSRCVHAIEIIANEEMRPLVLKFASSLAQLTPAARSRRDRAPIRPAARNA